MIEPTYYTLIVTRTAPNPLFNAEAWDRSQRYPQQFGVSNVESPTATGDHLRVVVTESEFIAIKRAVLLVMDPAVPA